MSITDLWRAPLHDFPIRDEIIDQFLPLHADMRILEVGPGNGFTAYRLASQVKEVSVLDVAAGNVARLRTSLWARSNVSFHCADTCGTGFGRQFASAPYDAVLGLEVLEYVPRPEAFLRNLAAVLKPGGTLLLQWPNYPPSKTGGVTWFPTRDDLARCVESAGLRQWSLYSLRLNGYADLVFRIGHEWPMRAYRRLRSRRQTASRPQTYDEVWAFRQGAKLNEVRVLVHAAWLALGAAIHLGGACFRREAVEGNEVRRNLLLIAQK